MYRYYVNKRAPVAFWMLDDDTPFQEYSGRNPVAAMPSGQAAPTKSAPLVAGAAYSSVFKYGSQARFDADNFQQGKEDRSFALEAWVLPVLPTQRTSARTNQVKNPSVSILNQWFGYGTTPTRTVDTTQSVVGGSSIKVVSTATGNSGVRHDVDIVPGSTKLAISGSMLSLVDAPRTQVLWTFADATTASTSPAIGSANSSNWQRLGIVYDIPANAVKATLRFYISSTAIGNHFWLDAVMAEFSDTVGTYFDGDTPTARWTGTAHQSPSILMKATGDQQILSHDTRFDGLSINGKIIRFGTEYLTSGSAFCSYDLGEYKLAHVVGIHNAESNQLYVNGELVATVQLTDAQKGDRYNIANNAYLYAGHSDAAQQVAMNAIAMYPTITSEDIKRNYEAGIGFIGQDRVYPQFGGIPFDLSAASGAVFIEETWVNKTDFERGLKTNVEYTPNQIEPHYVNDLSEAGSWTASIPLDAQDDTSIYGVMVEWTGDSVTVETSLDGVTWTAAVSGNLVTNIPNGFNPTGKDLQIRVKFASGLPLGQGYLESLHVIGFRNNNIENISARPVTVTYPAVVRGDYEPNLYRDDNGADLRGGTLTIGMDTSDVPDPVRTVEFWVKPVSGTVTITPAGTQYRNGVSDTSLPVGEWSLVHVVASADITSTITVSGDAIVGQATLYPDTLTAADIDFIWKSYTGRTSTRILDTSTVSVTEKATSAVIYAHDWAIDSAG